MTGKKTVAFHTLGCKLNFSETSSLSRLLEAEGFARKPFEETADVYVINTCSVTENADRECRQLVRRIQRQAPESLVVVTGCYAQLKPEEIARIPGVDLVLGAAEKFNLPRHLAEISKGSETKICSCDIGEVQGFHAAYSLSDRTRSFLKVQDGCDYNCSFCTIPRARGQSRSDTIEGVLKQTETLAARGVKEVVLTGVNLGDFGKNELSGSGHPQNFFDLVQALEAQGSIPRYRISSIEPNLLSDEIIDFVSGSRHFMPHFHIPLQSGSNRILGLMRRRYRRELYQEKVRRIKSLLPHCAIGVDVIVGFPGETATDFEETFQFLQDLDISYLHVFTYSERDQTAALDIRPVVPVELRQERNRRLRNLSFMKMQYFAEQHRGQRRPVLFESRNKNGLMEGYSDNYIRIEVPYQAEKVNQIAEWTL